MVHPNQNSGMKGFIGVKRCNAYPVWVPWPPSCFCIGQAEWSTPLCDDPVHKHYTSHFQRFCISIRKPLKLYPNKILNYTCTRGNFTFSSFEANRVSIPTFSLWYSWSVREKQGIKILFCIHSNLMWWIWFDVGNGPDSHANMNKQAKRIHTDTTTVQTPSPGTNTISNDTMARMVLIITGKKTKQNNCSLLNSLHFIFREMRRILATIHRMNIHTHKPAANVIQHPFKCRSWF